MGVGFEPYVKNWVGGSTGYWNSYSLQDVKNMLNVVNTRFTSIATYSMGTASYNVNNNWDSLDSNCLVARAAAQINSQKGFVAISVSQGIYQNSDYNIQQKEISNAFLAAQDANGIYPKTVWGLTFTNEYLTDVSSGNQIWKMITDNKVKATQMGLKVGTRIHVCGIIMNSSDSIYPILVNIVRDSDFIMCNMYPTPDVVNNVQNAANAVGSAFLSYAQKFRAINPNIKVMIGETGWPSQGISFNKSPNNVQNLKAYWSAINNWATNNGVLVHMFEAIDEPWKSNQASTDWNSFSGPNGAEGHYGWWYRSDTANGPVYVEKQ